MSRLLWTKAIRELRSSAAQFAVILLVVVLGVGVYLGMLSAYFNLGASYSAYYDRCGLADFHVELLPSTSRLADRIRRLPGVRKVHGRLVADLPLEQPGRGKRRVTCRVISLPERPRERVNDVIILDGRLPSARRREVLLEKRFAAFNGYRIGDRVRFVLDGYEVDYRVVGVAVSPEYIYPIRSKEYLVASPSTFGIAFLRRRQAEDLLEAWGQVNDIAVLCERGRRQAVMDAVDSLLDPYGAKDPEPREQQPSYYVLKMDLEGYKQIAVFFPAFMLLAAALALYTVLRRLVESQQPIIGFLRASGFSRAQVVAHYVAFPGLIGSIGAAGGIALGQGLAIGVTRLYLRVLNIPLLAAPFHWDLAASALALGMGTCLLGGAGPALSIARMHPAQALRDIPAAAGRRLLLERLMPSLRSLGFVVKLPLRNIARRPVRSLWMVLGIVAATGLMIVAGSWRDATDDLMCTYFRLMRVYDVELSFTQPATEHQVFRVRQWPGVWRAEGLLAVPVQVARRDRTLSTTLIGVSPESRLLHLRGLDGRRLPLRPGVVLVSRLLRTKLGVTTGDTLLMRYAFQTKFRRGELRARVGPPMRLPVGQSLYMPIADVRRAFRDALDLPPGAINSLILRAAPSAQAWIEDRLADLPWAATTSSMRETERDLEERMAFMDLFVALMMSFGAVLAISVIYATVSVGVLERRRELAALRAEGFSTRYIGGMVSAENTLIWLAGTAVGVPLGRWVALWLLGTFVTESLELAQVVYPRTLAVSAAVALAAVLISQWPALRYIARLDVAHVLRYRE